MGHYHIFLIKLYNKGSWIVNGIEKFLKQYNQSLLFLEQQKLRILFVLNFTSLSFWSISIQLFSLLTTLDKMSLIAAELIFSAP